jgi:hypothetical protein
MWRKDLPQYIDNGTGGDIYHFGIWFGDSLINIANSLTSPEKYRHIAFDSFEGLPLDPNEPLWHPQWHPETGHFNAYSAKTWAGTSEMDATLKAVAEYIEQGIGLLDNFVLVPGYYENSLTDDLVKSMDLKPAVYVDVDVDIYTSAIECLDFMLRNKLIVEGTIIGFDDWKCTPGWETNESGESRAWKEISEKYDVQSGLIYENFDGLQNWVVRVDKIG